MSELITLQDTRVDLRWQLLATASALALCGTAFTGAADAQESGRPTVWIELGGQMETIGDVQDPFAPPFTLKNIDAPYNKYTPLELQAPPRHAFGGEGSISFEPGNAGWVFSAAVRYGRSNTGRRVHQQSTTTLIRKRGTVNIPYVFNIFDDTKYKSSEAHAILDFAAGKDVGLGMFGKESRSVVSLGVRVAQFNARSNTILHSRPDGYYKTNMKYVGTNVANAHHHSYYATANVSRSFHGVGPSVSWSGSLPFIGDRSAGELALDWGANGAVLFGRQKVVGHDLVIGQYFHGSGAAIGPPLKSQYTHTAPVNRSRSVIVPNVGGFAGLSFDFPNAKVRAGYRADFFFGAMDSGIAARHTENLNFNGPFATISIGLGG